ncbi:MAG: NAD-dependent succinate-semialdehyde dehydrogenase [Chromatiales bacterium]|jgi:succinate-semialdehyde dehydrogenase/glutarate-semialdehyde dehydrogenase
MIESPLLNEVKGYIDGGWSAADSGDTFDVKNPATGELLASVPSMDRTEVRRAIKAAQRAQKQPSTLEQRRDWLAGIAQALTDERKEIGRILTMEHGKPWGEGQGEVDYAAGFFRFCAENIGELGSYALEARPRNCSWTVHYRPAGVVGLITPWNFPIGMIAKKLSAALAADCASIIKPSSKTPLTMIALFTLMHEHLDLPPGKVSLVTGRAGPIGDELCENPAVRMLSFTGSTEVGRELIRKTADQVKKLALELGGNAPYLVFADADLDQAVEQLVTNKFRGGGQTCVCSNRILVERGVAEVFSTKLGERVGRMRVGNGLEEGVDLGPLIDRSGYEKVRRHLNDALEKGAKMVAGGDPGEWTEDKGAFFNPTVVRGVMPGMLATQEETFGPLVPIMEFDGEEEAVSLANDTEYGLAAYVFTADDERAQRVIAALEFGHVGHNTGSGPTPEAPFGGMKQSGYGREGGREGLFEFVEPQTVPRGD